MIFYNVLRMLDTGLKSGVFHYDQNDKNRMLIYRTGNKETGAPEGWYSENIHAIAQELMHDEEGIKTILTEFEKRGIAFEEVKPWWTEKEEASDQ